ncbi:TIGR03768 family metallophosphoesterase [Acetobacterium wieringae]|uniref:TIGR03768 family metallophosphoesterase n=1 Tax=Acetobacterium wieringae TaxID=52694 RepID=A0A5D0WN82_9FIRM|nr:metallophosphoesterase [Acetobacterium wieringae]TYC85730.1 TIGR03768 family metallophosphoesterase [Acetobacterium wieringae]
MGHKRSKNLNSRLAKQLKDIEQQIIPVTVPVTNTETALHSEKAVYTFYLDPVVATAPQVEAGEIHRLAREGYGGWIAEDPKEPERRDDLMPEGYLLPVGNEPQQLLHFFAITDIHITDGEFPAHGIYSKFGGGIVSVYSEMMHYTTHILDGAIHSINAIHHQNPLDFGLSMGDNTNNAMYNELRWSIDIFDGKEINLDFGVSPNPRVGPRKPFYDEFAAVGLNPQIPWYQVIGNHDHSWPDKPLLPVSDDPARRFLSRAEWMKEFFITETKPSGHGFSLENSESGFACYSFEPRETKQIKVIVLDNTQRDDDQNVKGYAHGSLDRERFDWLGQELEAGQQAGQLMIIAAHIPIGVEYQEPLTRPFMSWSTLSPVSEQELLKKLQSYPNLILWVAGHRHRNTVTPIKSPDPAQPEYGFWVVETASLRDFPQNFRTFEILKNSDGTLSIVTRNINPTIREGSFASIARSYAVAAQQLFNGRTELLPSGSYNGELLVKTKA